MKSAKHTVDGKNNSPPLIGPKKEINKEINYFFLIIFLKTIGFYKTGFWLFPGVLEGLGSSGRLVGSFSTDPGTCKCPWSRVIAKNPAGGIFFYRPRYGNLSDEQLQIHLAAFLSRLHSCSRFTIEGLEGCVRSRAGTLAGTSLADLVFTCVIARILKEIRARFASAGLLYKLPTMRIQLITGLVPDSDFEMPENNVQDASFADDYVLIVVCSASVLLERTRKAIEIIHSVFSRFGLRLNYKKGNTAVVFFFHGPGAYKVKAEYDQSELDGIYFSDCNGHERFLYEETFYKHVGRSIDGGNTQHAEIAVRFCSMKRGFKKIKKSVEEQGD